MEITVLGSGGSEGIPVPYCDCRICKNEEHRLRTSYLIKIKDKNFLVEIGPDFRQQQLKYNFPIDYFFISHAHDDHMRGLIELGHIFLIANIKTKKMKILISSKLHKRFSTKEIDIIQKQGIPHNYQKLLTKEKIENHILKYYQKYHFKDFSLLLFKNKHGRTFSDGFLLETKEKKLIYLGDASKINKKTKELIEKEKVDLLIDHTPYFYTSHPKIKKKDHLGIETVQEMKIKKILVSHFSHRADLTHQEILKKLAPYHHNIVAAYDRMTIKL